MLDGLQEEINAHSEFEGWSRRLIKEALNKDDTAQVETWEVNNDIIKIPKGDMMAMISLSNLAVVLTWMKAEGDATALVFHEFYKAHDQFKVNDPMFRQLISGLESGGMISDEEKTSILRLGERKISRAEELFGRKLTMEDF